MKGQSVYNISRALIFLPLFLLLGFFMSSHAEGGSDFSELQTLVEKTVESHPDIVRLSIHATPTGERESRIIACNIKSKLGKPSDPEDLEAMSQNHIVVLKEGDCIDVTAPILDKSGEPIAATGITIRVKKGEDVRQMVERAKNIASLLNRAINNFGDRPW